MLITFLDVPCDECWNDGIEVLFRSEVDAILGSSVELETFRVTESTSKVIAMVNGAPENLSVESRRGIAKQVFLFLKYHGCMDGAIVYFSNFILEKNFDDRYFEPVDLALS